MGVIWVIWGLNMGLYMGVYGCYMGVVQGFYIEMEKRTWKIKWKLGLHRSLYGDLAKK